MKKNYFSKALALLAMLFFFGNSNAQSNYQVGSGTGTNAYLPLYTYYGYTYSQTIYLASELTAQGATAGFISSIKYYYATAGTTTVSDDNWQVYIGSTTQSSFSGTTNWITSGLSQVYSGSVTFPSSAGNWFEITFDEPFFWDGTSNIVLGIDQNEPGYDYPYAYFGYTSTSTLRSIEYYNDVTNPDPASPPTANYSSYGIPNTQFVITPQISVDCGVSALTSPQSPTCAGTFPVTAMIQNYGSSSVTSVNIGWSINGTTQTGTSYTSTLSNIQGGTSSAAVSLGNITLGSTPSNLKIWTSSPNGQTDSIAFNDTLTITLASSLSGVYTIGSTGADFNSIQAAVTALETYGVCGAVTFLLDDGTYAESIEVGAITGVSSTNTITFKSDPTNTSLANQAYTATGTGDNFLWKFNGAQYITIDSLNMSANSASYSRIIEFIGSNDYITIKNSNLTGQSVTTTSTYNAVVYNNSGTSNQANNIVFENNNVYGGSYQFYYWGGGSTSLEQDNKFINNRFEAYYYMGVYSYYQNNCEFVGNYFESAGTYNSTTSGYNLYRYYNDGESHVIGNTFNNKNNGGYTIYAAYCDASSANPAIIANNFIAGTNSSASGTLYGLYLQYSSYQKVYHNNISLAGGNSSGAGARLYFSSSTYAGNEFINNVVSNTSSTPAIYFYASGATINSDYNVYNYPNGNLGYYNTAYSTLAAMQAGTSGDVNSINTDPLFLNQSIADLHTGSADLDGTGTPVGVLTDIDGTTRSLTTPDRGADEFIIPANDASTYALLSPSNPLCGDSAMVEIVVINTGIEVLTSVNVNGSINGSALTSLNWTGSLAPAALDTVTLGMVALNGGDELKVWTSLPNALPDSNSLLDTISVVMMEGLSGTYNIPGDFASITGAVDTLNMTGTCDTVIFRIASGTYDEPVVINEFPKANANTPVIFESSTGNLADVIWDNSTASRTIEVNGADFVWFRDLTIQNSNTAGTNAFYLGGGANSLKIMDSRIIGVSLSTTSNTYATIYDAPGNDENLEITGNSIENGSYGIYTYGSSTTDPQPNTLIEGNLIRDFYYMGSYAYYHENLIYTNNEITNPGYSTAYGCYFAYANGDLTITSNHIHPDTSGIGFYYGMLITQCVGTGPFTRGDVSNNIVITGYAGYSGYTYGLYLSSSSFQNVYHNTSLVIDGGPFARAGYVVSSNGNEYINNIFACLPSDTNSTYGNGYAMYYSSGALFNMDHNNFYSAGTTPIYFLSAYSGLASYQAATLNDMNSFDVNPNFSDTINAILCNDFLDGSGMALNIMTDQDGNARNANTPDIGAIEFQGVGNFSIGPDTTICDSETTLMVGAGGTVIWQDANSSTLSTGTSVTVNSNTSFPVSVSYSNSCGSANDEVTLSFVSNVDLDSSLHLCASSTETLIPDGNGSPNASYSWFPTAEITSQIDVDAPGIYTVTKSEDGCVSQATIEVTQSDDISIADAEACQSTLPFTVNASIANATSYTWSGGSSTSTAQNDFTTSGNYSITATDSFGCTVIDTFNFEAIDIPVAVISNDSHASNLFFFSSLASQNVGANGSYLWTFGDGSSSTDANPSHLFPWNGTSQTFTVTLTITNDCGTSETYTMDVTSDPLGINSANGISALAVYPNPTSGIITIAGDFGSSNVTVEVIDLSGRLVKSYNNASHSGNQFTINLEGLAKGSYQIKIVNGTDVQVAKVILN